MHQSIHISYNNNCIQCDEFIIRAQNCKNTGGVRAHFLQKYERYTGRNTSAGKNCFFSNAITQFLDGPFNGLSGLFKLQFLSSDSFFYQLGSENFILARNYEKVRVRNHCWSNYMGEITKIRAFYGQFSQNAHICERARSYTGGFVTLQTFNPTSNQRLTTRKRRWETIGGKLWDTWRNY